MENLYFSGPQRGPTFKDCKILGVEQVEMWIVESLSKPCSWQPDFGLSRIADRLGKTAALDLYWEGAAKEAAGDIKGGIALYRKAFRLWPALDSISEGGLPRCVRAEAEAACVDCDLLTIIDVDRACGSRVMRSPALLTASDIGDIHSVVSSILATETLFTNNSQNRTHENKTCVFLNNPPHYHVCHKAPHVLAKMLHFGLQVWAEANWSGDSESLGPLHKVTGGLESLSIRVVEYWDYSIGGGLVDPLHYDVDSVITLVALLSDDFEGGVFRTYEVDKSHLEHPMAQGDVICFVSHKYHNVTPVIAGRRRSLVMELWQGGMGQSGR